MSLRRFLLIAMCLPVTLSIAACSLDLSGNGSTSGVNGSNHTVTLTPTTSDQPLTEQLNLQFTYASVDYTVTSVQEAKNFPGDTNRYEPDQIVVRVNIQEKSSSPYSASFSFYDQIAHLLLSDGSAIQLSFDRFDRAVDPQTSRTNWLDFPVTGPMLDLSKLTLQIGFPTEAQVDVPLTPNADLSQYGPKTAALNKTLQYAGLTYTLTTATESLGANGHQAGKGQIFVTLNMKVTNPTPGNFSGFAGDYMRLQSGDTTSPPTYNGPDNFLDGISAQSSETGYLVFTMPQGSTSFTLMFLAFSGVSGTTTTFQIS